MGVEWIESDYVSWAINTANLPGDPTGRVMRFEVASHPSPQVILTQDHGGAAYRAVLFELLNVGGSLTVLDVTPEHTVASALRDLPAPVEWIPIVADLRNGLAVSYIHRQVADAFSPIPLQADVVHIVRAATVNMRSIPSQPQVDPPALRLRTPLLMLSMVLFCGNSLPQALLESASWTRLLRRVLALDSKVRFSKCLCMAFLFLKLCSSH